MIAFASLFLGLVLGVKPVEIVVGEGVASVELALDGETVGMLHEPPWVLEVDFGDELAPAHLEAIARDGAEQEVARIEQWLNLPTSQVVINATLEPRKEGQPRVALLSWESTVGAEPQSVTASVDGVPITITDPRRIELPPVDEQQLHLLNVEMRFEKRASARLDFTFGGLYVDHVSTEMTALPIRRTQASAQPPTVAQAQSWFAKDGESVRVIAVERGPAEVVVVMGRPFPHLLDPGRRQKLPKDLNLPKGFGMRFVSPIPTQTEGVETSFELFPISPVYDREVADLYSLLTNISRPKERRDPLPGSALGVAGLAAYESRRRRAIVLIPSANPAGEDDYPPALSRGYLERLRVPFYIWDPESKPVPQVETWGTVRSVPSLKKLAEAFADLRSDLDEQWIVWIDGQHLPQDIALTPAAKGFTLQGSSSR